MNKETEAKFRTVLSEHLEYSADFRARKAEEFPEDTRNAHSAKALSQLATAVWDDAVMPTEVAESLFELTMERYAVDVPMFCEDASYAISRYGFNSHEDASAFVKSLVTMELNAEHEDVTNE
jgi:hypothetical protein